MSDSDAGGKKSAKDSGSGPASTSEPKSKSSAGSSGGKSSKESVGGRAAVHYGYFSNVRSDDYRGGWDDIWNKKTKTKPKSGRKRR